MIKKKGLFWLYILTVFFIVSQPFFQRVVNAEKPDESQFTLLFMEGGKWKDYEGNEKILDDTIYLGEATGEDNEERTQDCIVSAWHYANDAENGVPPHWNIDGKFKIFDSDLGGDKTYYENFNEKMKEHQIDFEFILPDKVKSAVESEKKIFITIKPVKTIKDGKELDIDKIFHGPISQAGADFEILENKLNLSLPVKFNFLLQGDVLLSEPRIMVVEDIIYAFKARDGQANNVQQLEPGTPVPDFGYGVLMGALWKYPKETGPVENGKIVGIGSVDIGYSDGNGLKYSDTKNPWWMGNFRKKSDDLEADIGTAEKFDKEMLEYYTPGRGPIDTVQGDTVAIGVDGAFYNLAAVGVGFYYPLEVAFYLQEDPSDISVEVSRSVSSANPDDPIDLAFSVVSTFADLDDTEYEIYIEGTGAGDSVQRGTLEFSKPDGRLNRATIPCAFTMPDNDVRITVTVNPADVPAEAMRSNNIAIVHVALVPTLPSTRGDLEIDYNILRTERAKKLPIYLGTSTASLDLPNGEWTDNATGALTVVNETPGIYRGFRVENNPPVNEESENISRAPVVHLALDRADFGDRPQDGVYASGDIKKEGRISAQGTVSRPWKYEYSVTNHNYNLAGQHEGCEKETIVETGTASAYFQNILDVKSVVAKVYNGREILLPPVFTERVENNGRTKELRWTSRPITLDVVRLMYNEDERGVLYPSEGIPVDGRYLRTFTAQNDATVAWDSPISSKMWKIYEPDRNGSLTRSTKNPEKAVFASDLGYKSVDYPIRSGYYFNPTGEYELIVTTTLYKDKHEPDGIPETEHKAFVEALESAFRYESNMVYIDMFSKAVAIDGERRDKTGTSYAAQTAVARKGQSPDSLCPIVFIESFEKKLVELKHFYHETDGKTDARLKRFLEGYEESDTARSSRDYKYNELIKKGQTIYEITETTTVEIKVNPDDKKVYTHAQMKNGDYKIRVYIDNVYMKEIMDDVTNGRLGSWELGELTLDEMEIKVVGSMYDDIR